MWAGKIQVFWEKNEKMADSDKFIASYVRNFQIQLVRMHFVYEPELVLIQIYGFL